MKKKLSTIVKGIFIIAVTIFMIFPAMAQKEKGASLITQDQINQITELVKPLRDQLEKQLNSDDRYKAYVEDLKKIHAATSIQEKTDLTLHLKKTYAGFFKEVWSAYKESEPSYQLKIRRILPRDFANLIQFDSFLNFTLVVSTSTMPAPESVPPDKCINVCSIAAGEIKSNATLIAGAGGNYGNCFLNTSAWGTGAFFYGSSEVNGYLRNNITIPGTFPDDSRRLRVKKSYELKQEATSFAALGGGYAETRSQTFQTSEYMLVYSPIIWGSQAVKMKTMSENYLLDKKDVAKSIFKSYSNTTSMFGSGNWSYSQCRDIKWTICEEQ